MRTKAERLISWRSQNETVNNALNVPVASNAQQFRGPVLDSKHFGDLWRADNRHARNKQWTAPENTKTWDSTRTEAQQATQAAEFAKGLQRHRHIGAMVKMGNNKHTATTQP